MEIRGVLWKRKYLRLPKIPETTTKIRKANVLTDVAVGTDDERGLLVTFVVDGRDKGSDKFDAAMESARICQHARAGVRCMTY